MSKQTVSQGPNAQAIYVTKQTARAIVSRFITMGWAYSFRHMPNTGDCFELVFSVAVDFDRDLKRWKNLIQLEPYKG